MTVAALTARATINTISICMKLTPIEILRLNGIRPRTGSHADPLDDVMLRGGFQDEMDHIEAMMILGFGPDDKLDTKTIKSRYRKMMMLNHPDRGGSPMLSMKINKAKELLENYK